MKNNMFVVAAASAMVVMMTSAAFAQEKVCVNLLVGAGYAARLEVKLGDMPQTANGKSDSFAIGKTKCIAIKDLVSKDVTIKQGTQIRVALHPYLGKTVDCTPNNISYDKNRTDNLMYNAWGTTLNAKCSQ